MKQYVFLIFCLCTIHPLWASEEGKTCAVALGNESEEGIVVPFVAAETPEERRTEALAAAVNFREYFAAIGKNVKESDFLIKAMELTFIAKEALLLVGPPGNAKTMAMDLALRNMIETVQVGDKRIERPSFFTIQMTKETMMQETHGPYDYGLLTDKGIYRRKLEEGMILRRNVGIDEFWDARVNSRRNFLKAMAEREHAQGRHITPARIEVMLAASNKYMTEVYDEAGDDSPKAVFDRFAFIILTTSEFQDSESYTGLIRGAKKKKVPMPQLHFDDMDRIRALVPDVEISEHAAQFLNLLSYGMKRETEKIEHAAKKRYREQIRDGEEAPPPYRSTKYHSKRTVQKAGAILKAIVVRDWVEKKGQRELKAGFNDILELEKFLCLESTDNSFIEHQLLVTTDPNERAQLQTVSNERRIFKTHYDLILQEVNNVTTGFGMLEIESLLKARRTESETKALKARLLEGLAKALKELPPGIKQKDLSGKHVGYMLAKEFFEEALGEINSDEEREAIKKWVENRDVGGIEKAGEGLKKEIAVIPPVSVAVSAPAPAPAPAPVGSSVVPAPSNPHIAHMPEPIEHSRGASISGSDSVTNAITPDIFETLASESIADLPLPTTFEIHVGRGESISFRDFDFAGNRNNSRNPEYSYSEGELTIKTGGSPGELKIDLTTEEIKRVAKKTGVKTTQVLNDGLILPTSTQFPVLQIFGFQFLYEKDLLLLATDVGLLLIDLINDKAVGFVPVTVGYETTELIAVSDDPPARGCGRFAFLQKKDDGGHDIKIIQVRNDYVHEKILSESSSTQVRPVPVQRPVTRSRLVPKEITQHNPDGSTTKRVVEEKVTETFYETKEVARSVTVHFQYIEETRKVPVQYAPDVGAGITRYVFHKVRKVRELDSSSGVSVSPPDTNEEKTESPPLSSSIPVIDSNSSDIFEEIMSSSLAHANLLTLPAPPNPRGENSFQVNRFFHNRTEVDIPQDPEFFIDVEKGEELTRRLNLTFLTANNKNTKVFGYAFHEDKIIIRVLESTSISLHPIKKPMEDISINGGVALEGSDLLLLATDKGLLIVDLKENKSLGFVAQTENLVTYSPVVLSDGSIAFFQKRSQPGDPNIDVRVIHTKGNYINERVVSEAASATMSTGTELTKNAFTDNVTYSSVSIVGGNYQVLWRDGKTVINIPVTPPSKSSPQIIISTSSQLFSCFFGVTDLIIQAVDKVSQSSTEHKISLLTRGTSFISSSGRPYVPQLNVSGAVPLVEGDYLLFATDRGLLLVNLKTDEVVDFVAGSEDYITKDLLELPDGKISYLQKTHTSDNWELRIIQLPPEASVQLPLSGGTETKLNTEGPQTFQTSWAEIKKEHLDFAKISFPPGGEKFTLGSPQTEEGRSDDENQREVLFDEEYEIQTTLVTQGLYQKVMGNNPSSYKGDLNRPVENVSWVNVQEFIKTLNHIDPDHSYRLPSEAEWEYAARAGSHTKYHFGDNVDDLKDYAWVDTTVCSIHPVAMKKPNAFGLYDMHGNVWQWVQDTYQSDITKHTNQHPIEDGGGSSRVLRGGYCCASPQFLRSAFRGNFDPAKACVSFGFRLVRTPKRL